MLYLVFCLLCNFYLYCVRIIKFLLFVYTYGLYLSFQKLFFLKGHTHFFLQILRVGLVFRVHIFRSPLNLGCIQYYPKMGFLYLRRGGVMVFELVSVTLGFRGCFRYLLGLARCLLKQLLGARGLGDHDIVLHKVLTQNPYMGIPALNCMLLVPNLYCI